MSDHSIEDPDVTDEEAEGRSATAQDGLYGVAGNDVSGGIITSGVTDAVEGEAREEPDPLDQVVERGRRLGWGRGARQAPDAVDDDPPA